MKEFCTQKVKLNITMKGQAAPNYRKRKSKRVELPRFRYTQSNLQTTKTTK
jgi:hypothetical protein